MPTRQRAAGRAQARAVAGRAPEGARGAPRARARGRTPKTWLAPHVRDRPASVGSRQPLARLLRERTGLQARPTTSPHVLDQPAVEAVPAWQERRVVLLGVPEDREAAAVLGSPVEQRREPRPGLLDAEVQVALGGQRDVHRRERHLDQVVRRFPLEVPGPERMRDPGPESDRVAEAEGRVVGEASRLERAQVSVRVDAQEVVALALDRPGQRLEPLLLAREALGIVCGRVAAVEPDLGVSRLERLDEMRPQPLVGLGRGAVEVVRVLGEQEESRRGARSPLVAQDAVEAPVRVGAADLVHRRAGKPAQLAKSGTDAAGAEVALGTRSCSLHAATRPLPGDVDVVRERDGEPRPAPPWRLDPQASTQPLHGRIEWIEARRRRPEAVVLVPRPVQLFEAGEVEERLRQVVAAGPLAAVDLLPRLGAVRHVVAEPEVAGADRVEHPAGPSLDELRNHRKTPRATRAAWTRPGLRSSRAKTASTYGGFGSSGRSPGISEIDHVLRVPFIVAGTTSSPVRSRYAINGRSTPQAAARPCHCQRRGLTSISLKRPSRGSRLNSTCEMPWKPRASRRRRPASTTSCTQTASPTRHVPTSGGTCFSFRPQKRPSGSPSARR